MVRDSSLVVTVTAKACVYGAVMLLAVPTRWFVAWIVASVCHELFHCFALLLCGKPIEKISIGAHGARIYTSSLHPGETVCCALAGPAGGVLLIFLGRFFPRLAICALIQTAFNLLPILPLDGGRALHGFLRLVFPNSKVDTICKNVKMSIIGVSVAASFIAAIVWKLGLVPVLVTIVFAVIGIKEKFLANGAFSRYNSATKTEEVRL